MTIKLYLLFALALTIGYGFGRYHARYRTSNFQNSGEALVSRTIESNFNTPDYHLLNHITLTLEDGTTQIDHILVSRFGVFVIETKTTAVGYLQMQSKRLGRRSFSIKSSNFRTQFFKMCDMSMQ